jgi:RNA polymerase sigma factor (sigma-70 family)
MPETVVPVSGTTAQEQLTGAQVAALFARFRPALVRFFERRSFSAADAEDLTQEVFVKITRLEQSTSIWHPEAFLFRIAANVLRDRVRREAARHRDDHVALDESTTDGGEEPSEESVYEGRESVRRLLAALAQLTPKCRSIFLLHKYEGLSYSEVARRFDISVSAVEKHMIHAIKHLKQHWQGGER